MGVLEEVYKTKTGGLYAVIEKLTDVTAEKSDPFLIEAKIKVWKRTKEFFVTSNLHDLFAVPLLHACSAEDPPTPACSFVTGDVDVREERANVTKSKTYYNCIGRRGQYFLANAASFSIPTGIGLGCC